MRTKTLLIASVTVLVLTLGVLQIARTVLERSFAGLELDSGRQSAARVRKAFEADLAQLRVSAADYAQWDDAYEFAHTQNPEFVRGNFTRTNLQTLHVDVVWITDARGRTLLGVRPVQAKAGESAFGELVPLAPELTARLTQELDTISNSESLSPLTRVLRVPDGLLAFAGVRIVRTNLSGPEAGIVMFGRYLNDAVIQRVEQTSQLPVSVDLVGGSRPVRLSPAVASWLAAAKPDTAPLVELDDPNLLESHSVIFDSHDRPLAVLSTTTKRDSLQAGKQAVMGVILALTVGFAIVVASLIAILNRSWNARAASERKQRAHRRRLSHLKRHDPLTGLANRRHLRSHLPRLIERARRDNSILALFYVDIDRFKDVNDVLGHGTGDRLLVYVADRLRSCVAAHDLVIRMGGDEFIIVATGLPDVAIVHSIARRIQTALGEAVNLEGVEIRPAVSVGITLFPEDGAGADDLIKNAGIAVGQAKQLGRANYQFFAPEMNERLAERLKLEQALHGAIENGQLFIEYQPSFDLQSERPVGLEALLRWNHPELGRVPPSRFIPIAEQSGLIIDLGEWVLRQVCAQLRAWQQDAVPLLPVSINVSARQLAQTRFAETVGRAVREIGVEPNLLYFEITESAVMQDTEQHRGTLQALRRLGSRILIDDFGTGYSSLSYLKHLPIDTLKIDRAFVRDMASDANDAAIVRAIVGVANSLGLHLVAEGIETAEQLARLRELGCQTGQGFYFRRPLSATDCRLLLLKLAGQRRLTDTLKLRILSAGGDRT